MTDPLLRKCHRHPKKDLKPDICHMCRGSGWLGNRDCPHCGGEGVVYEL